MKNILSVVFFGILFAGLGVFAFLSPPQEEEDASIREGHEYRPRQDRSTAEREERNPFYNRLIHVLNFRNICIYL